MFPFESSPDANLNHWKSLLPPPSDYLVVQTTIESLNWNAEITDCVMHFDAGVYTCIYRTKLNISRVLSLVSAEITFLSRRKHDSNPFSRCTSYLNCLCYCCWQYPIFKLCFESHPLGPYKISDLTLLSLVVFSSRFYSLNKLLIFACSRCRLTQ